MRLRQTGEALIGLMESDPLAAQGFLYGAIRITVSPLEGRTVIDNILIL